MNATLESVTQPVTEVAGQELAALCDDIVSIGLGNHGRSAGP